MKQRLTPFQREVLAAISGGAAYHNEIREHLWNGGRRTIHEQRLMSAIASLRTAGLVQTSLAGRNTVIVNQPPTQGA